MQSREPLTAAGAEGSATLSKRATLALIGGVFAVGTEALVISLLLRDLSASLDAPIGSVGLIVSAYGITLAVTAPLFGPVSDLVSRRRVMIASLLVFAAASFACSFATSFTFLLLARAVCGVAAGCFLPAAYAYVGDEIAYAHRARVMGRVMSGWAAAMLLGVPVGAMIAGAWGWRSTFLAIGAAAVVVCLLVARLPEAHRPAGGGRIPGDGIRTVYTSALRVSGVPVLLLTNFFNMFGFFGAYTYLGAFVRHAFDVGSAGAGAWVVLYGTGLALATLNAGFADRIGKERSVIAALAGLTAVLAGLPYAAAVAPLFGVMLLLWGVLQGFAMSTLTAVASGRSAEERGRILSLITCMTYLGVTFGSASMGFIYQSVGFNAVGIACAVSTALGMALFTLLFALPQSRMRQPA